MTDRTRDPWPMRTAEVSPEQVAAAEERQVLKRQYAAYVKAVVDGGHQPLAYGRWLAALQDLTEQAAEHRPYTALSR